MIRLSKKAPSRRSNSESSRSPPTRHLTRTARCTPLICTPPSRDSNLFLQGTLKGVFHRCFCGTWMTAGLLVWSSSRRVGSSRMELITGRPLTHPATALPPSGPNEPSGSWDSIHVFEANERGRMAHYKLTSTIMLQLKIQGETSGEVDLSGSMTRQVSFLRFLPLKYFTHAYCSKKRIDLCPNPRPILRIQATWSRIWSSKCVTFFKKFILARRGM